MARGEGGAEPVASAVGIGGEIQPGEGGARLLRRPEGIEVAAEIQQFLRPQPQGRQLTVVERAVRYGVERTHAASSAFNSTGTPQTTR